MQFCHNDLMIIQTEQNMFAGKNGTNINKWYQVVELWTVVVLTEPAEYNDFQLIIWRYIQSLHITAVQPQFLRRYLSSVLS